MAIATFLFMLSVSAFGEHRKQEQMDRLLQQRIEFITSKIELTEEEKEKFVPLYEEFQEKQISSFEKNNRREANCKEEKNYTEEDFRKKNESYFNEKLERATLDRIYYEKLREILPESKIYNLYKAEKAYRRDLLRQVKNQKRENMTPIEK